jgi:hypothetical protein
MQYITLQNTSTLIQFQFARDVPHAWYSVLHQTPGHRQIASLRR